VEVVQRQLGYVSIQLPVDTYGKCPMRKKAVVDALDTPSGSKVVANASQAGAGDEKKRKSESHPPESNRRPTDYETCQTGFLLSASRAH
jgi:hypothetical protein